jgi:hypothetical protein
MLDVEEEEEEEPFYVDKLVSTSKHHIQGLYMIVHYVFMLHRH